MDVQVSSKKVTKGVKSYTVENGYLHRFIQSTYLLLARIRALYVGKGVACAVSHRLCALWGPPLYLSERWPAHKSLAARLM